MSSFTPTILLLLNKYICLGFFFASLILMLKSVMKRLWSIIPGWIDLDIGDEVRVHTAHWVQCTLSPVCCFLLLVCDCTELGRFQWICHKWNWFLPGHILWTWLWSRCLPVYIWDIDTICQENFGNIRSSLWLGGSYSQFSEAWQTEYSFSSRLFHSCCRVMIRM